MMSIMLEKNGKTVDFLSGGVSTDRITAIQEVYWSMASARSEANGINYTDPEELELVVATLIDLDAMDGKSSVSLLAECSSSPNVAQVIMKDSYTGPNATVPLPLADDATLDIVFPDWSFSGWPEINIKPWEFLLEKLKEGNDKVKWTEREPYAYWKENPGVLKRRQDLLKCKITDKVDWNACLYAQELKYTSYPRDFQDWGAERVRGYRKSNLAYQCNHRINWLLELKVLVPLQASIYIFEP